MYTDEFLETFVPSGQMRDHLRSRGSDDRKTMSDIVKSSLVPLEVKSVWLDREDCFEMTEAVRELLYPAGRDELFCLFSAWYDNEIYNDKRCFLCPVGSFEKATERIRYDKAVEGSDVSDAESCVWYILEKWKLDEDGDYCRLYTYYIIDEKAVYFEKGAGGSCHPFESRNLNLSVPFDVGDILTVDCRPFAPPVHAVLIEKGDNIDCCCLQVLYKDLYTGEWMTCSLKHGLRLKSAEGGGYLPLSSPLLRLRLCDDGISDDEALLRSISEYIDGVEERGQALWDLLHGKKPDDRYASPRLTQLYDVIKNSRNNERQQKP